MNKVLVTGAAGFVGRHICKEMYEHGHIVYALVRSDPEWALQHGYKPVVADLLNVDQYFDVMSTIDIVIHCAGNPKFGNGPSYARDNVGTIRALINAIQLYGSQVSRFIYVSTIGAVDRPRGDQCNNPITEISEKYPTTDYGRTKLESEKLIIESDIPYTIIRPALIVGVDMRVDSHFAVFARWVINNKIISRIFWPGRFSVLDVDDFASAVCIVAESDKAVDKIYMCGGDDISLGEFFKTVLPEKKTVNLNWLFWLFSQSFRWLPFNIKSLLMPCLVADDTALRKLGWNPTKDAINALKPVVQREYARIDPDYEHPLGITIVTGAASGLGESFIEWLSSRRKNILAVDKNLHALDQLKIRYPNLKTLALDLDEIDLSVDKFKYLIKGTGEKYYSELYACAGLGRRGLFARDDIKKQLAMVNVNLIARIQQVHVLSNEMKRMQWGRIVLISSSSAFQSLPYMSVYAATNAGLLSFGEGVSYELKNEGIQIMTACPGGMKTSFQKTAGVRELSNETLMEPKDAVLDVINGVRSNNITKYVSLRTVAMSLVARILPRKWLLILWGKLMGTMR